MALEMTYTTWDSEHHIYVYDTLGRVVCSESQNFRVLLLHCMTMIWINEQRSQNSTSYLCCPQSVMYQKHSILYVGHVEVQNKLVNLLPSLSGIFVVESQCAQQVETSAHDLLDNTKFCPMKGSQSLLYFVSRYPGRSEFG